VQLVKEITDARERAIPLSEVTRPAVLRGSRPVHRAQVYRWAFRGLKNGNGTRVCLETCRLPGGLVNTHEAVLRFILATNSLEPSQAPLDIRARYTATRERLLQKGVIR
jgi:hypothetical protein